MGRTLGPIVVVAVALGLAPGEAAVPAPRAERTIPVAVFPGAAAGPMDPAFQALILAGSFTDVPPARHARGSAPFGGLLAWLRPPLATPRFTLGPLALLREIPRQAASPAGEAAGEALGIQHEDVGCVVADSYPELRACITPRERLGRAQVFFRPQGTEPWYAVDMEDDGACLSGWLPKPKASLAAFEYYIGAVGTDFDQVSLPASAPDTAFTARVVKAAGDCEKGRRLAMMAARVTAPILMESAGSAPLPAGFSPEGVSAGAPAGIDVSLVATGSSSGDVLQLQAVNASGEPVRIAMNPGTVVVPVRRGASTPVAAKAKGGLKTESVRGFCLEFAKAPPAPGTMYRVADAGAAGRYRPLIRVLEAANGLARQGGLHPDSDPSGYADSIRQWALWARLAGWDAAQFAEAFVSRTRKNVEEMKRPWTPEMEAAIRAAAPGRWRDIEQVLGAAEASRPGPPRP